MIDKMGGGIVMGEAPPRDPKRPCDQVEEVVPSPAALLPELLERHPFAVVNPATPVDLIATATALVVNVEHC